jgi:hypothetical protein
MVDLFDRVRHRQNLLLDVLFLPTIPGKVCLSAQYPSGNHTYS